MNNVAQSSPMLPRCLFGSMLPAIVTGDSAEGTLSDAVSTQPSHRSYGGEAVSVKIVENKFSVLATDGQRRAHVTLACRSLPHSTRLPKHGVSQQSLPHSTRLPKHGVSQQSLPHSTRLPKHGVSQQSLPHSTRLPKHGVSQQSLPHSTRLPKHGVSQQSLPHSTRLPKHGVSQQSLPHSTRLPKHEPAIATVHRVSQCRLTKFICIYLHTPTQIYIYI